MAERLSLRDFKKQQGVTSGEEWMDLLEEWSSEGVAPALCSEGCEVEPDGTCPHGNPSVLMVVGII